MAPFRPPLLLLAVLAPGLRTQAAAPNPILDPPAASSRITVLDPRVQRVDLPPPERPAVITVDQAKQLFVDDQLIASRTGLQRTLHPPRKHPSNPLLTPVEAWEKPSVLLYGTVMHDPARTTDRFRMWYLCFTPVWNADYSSATDKRSGRVAYAESVDGLTWTRPRLGLHLYQESRDNNIVIPNAYGFAGIMLDPRDPDPRRRYKAMIRTGRGHEACFSADGLRWSEPVPMNLDGYDRSSVFWDPVRGRWAASTKSWYTTTAGAPSWRGRGYQESDDFLQWPGRATFMVGTPAQGPEIVYGLECFYYESLYLGWWSRYRHEPDGLLDIQLAVSRNGRHWERPSLEPWLPVTPLPEGYRRTRLPRSADTGVDPLDPRVPWDYGNNSVNSLGPVRVGDELWIYYSGRSSDHRSNPQTGAIGLAIQRLDGFFSLDAGETAGRLLTTPLQLANPTLHLNADARGGELRLAVVDADGNSIPPFTLENCQPVTTDDVRHVVRWRGAADVSALQHRTVRLQFELTRAKLFSFWTGAERRWTTPDTTTWSTPPPVAR